MQRLRDEFAKAASDPAVKAKLIEAGLDPIEQMQPADFARLIAIGSRQMDADHHGIRRQRGIAGELAMSKTTRATQALEKLGVKFTVHTL